MAKRLKPNPKSEQIILTNEILEKAIIKVISDIGITKLFDEAQKKMIDEGVKISRHLERLSQKRYLYTIEQAAYRLNCSRNTFESEFVHTGHINLFFQNGKKLVKHSEIENYLTKLQSQK